MDFDESTWDGIDDAQSDVGLIYWIFFLAVKININICEINFNMYLDDLLCN